MTDAGRPIGAEQLSSALMCELEVEVTEELDSLLVAEAILVVEGLGLFVDEVSLASPITVAQVVEATNVQRRVW